ncbi:hypothetical protein NA57DRAFT_77803 [Rhizodiscina lignyota]|uniref:Eukaryotic translation initiation factor 3 30 kDa subunit n=1 Tax=Rhizodiscina lignyota TaxID=1504668 RepID=A0A9P4IFI0_9PEZI|nr:hypothetical protein NA57DRAFT_77803 [Rhizodiscina lignyota]
MSAGKERERPKLTPEVKESPTDRSNSSDEQFPEAVAELQQLHIFNPNTKVDFEELRVAIAENLGRFRKHEEYLTFLADLIWSLCIPLKPGDVEDFARGLALLACKRRQLIDDAMNERPEEAVKRPAPEPAEEKGGERQRAKLFIAGYRPFG